MQWLIDMVLESLEGIIVEWSGAIVDIPSGWSLCDGSNGTPDLRNRFVVGAGDTYAPAASGGAATHNHDFTSNPHSHDLWEHGDIVGDGEDWDTTATIVAVTGTTDAGSTLPPYYALAYIMKT